MRTKLPPHVTREKNRHKTPVFYFRVGKGPRTRLPDFGTEDFDDAYRAALCGEPVSLVRGHKLVRHGTLAWGIAQYKQTLHFRNLNVITRRRRDAFFQQMVDKSGSVALERFTEDMIITGREKFATGKGHAANNFLKAVKPVFAYARIRNWISVDPTRNVDFVKTAKGGFLPWSMDDYRAFEARHPLGTMANLAVRILLFVGLRRSDAVKLGDQHIRNGVINFTPGKTENSSGAVVSFKVLPPLREAIEATREMRTEMMRGNVAGMALLLSELGTPFASGASFGNWFRDRCNEAGLKRCTAHGLRKLGPTMAAESGATPHELMAMWGWSTLQQAELYTRGASRRSLGDAAADKLMAAMGLEEEQIANNIPLTLKSGAGTGEIS